jgi:hypothetical protein
VGPSPGWLKNGRVASFVRPKSSVRVRFFEPVDAPAVEVFWIPETAIQRVCLKLKKRPGRHETTLDIQKGTTAQGRIVSELWKVGNPNLGRKPAEYVAVADGARPSTVLRVADELSLEHENGRWSTEIDPAAIAGAAGAAAGGVLAALGALFAKVSPIKLKREGKKVRLEGTVRAAVDPQFRLRVLTASSDRSLETYLKDYLPRVAEMLEVDSDLFGRAFDDEFKRYLAGGSYPSFEINPQSFSLDAGRTQETSIEIYSNGPGQIMFCLAAIHSNQIISVSDLIGLSVTTEGSVFLDF